MAYPNPANDYTQLRFFLKTSMNLNLCINNLEGKELYSSRLGVLPEGENQTRVVLSDLPKGTYICTLKERENLLSSCRLTISE